MTRLCTLQQCVCDARGRHKTPSLETPKTMPGPLAFNPNAPAFFPSWLNSEPTVSTLVTQDAVEHPSERGPQKDSQPDVASEAKTPGVLEPNKGNDAAAPNTDADKRLAVEQLTPSKLAATSPRASDIAAAAIRHHSSSSTDANRHHGPTIHISPDHRGMQATRGAVYIVPEGESGDCVQSRPLSAAILRWDTFKNLETVAKWRCMPSVVSW